MTKSPAVLFPVLLLAACAQAGSNARGYGDDALPSAETTAFQAADARLRWSDARIEYDARACAVYQGRDAQGRIRQEPLRRADGQPICASR